MGPRFIHDIATDAGSAYKMLVRQFRDCAVSIVQVGSVY